MLPIDFNLFVVVRDGTVKLPKSGVGSTTAVVSIVMHRIDLDLRVIILDCALQIALQEVSISTTIIRLPVNGSNLDNSREVLDRSFDLTQGVKRIPRL